MDNKILNSLQHIGYWLEELTKTLEDSKGKTKTPTANILQSGGLEDKLEALSKGIEKIIDDNKTIIKNQETIISLAKDKKESKDSIDVASDPKQKNKIKDGLGTILLIAVGIVAIGMAFKLVGKVDILSVLSLALALPLVAFAFEKISKIKINPKKLIITTLAISTAVTLSSYILSMVQPVGVLQLLTTVFIASAFGAIGYGLSGLLKSFKKVSIGDAIKASLMLPLVLVAVSYAIALSSHALTMVQPVGLFQLITTVFIAGAFAAIGYGLSGLLKAFDKVSVGGAIKASIMLPLVLVAVSYAIAYSSHALSLVQPVGLFQVITTALIGLAFIPISYAITFLAESMSKVKNPIKFSILAPILLVAMAGAIYATSLIFSQVEEIKYSTLFNILAQGVTLAAIGFVMSQAFKPLSKVSLGNAIKGGLVLIIMSGVIMASSLILGVGNYGNYPGLNWILGVGASLTAFAIGAFVIGGMVFGPQALVFLAGIAALAALSGTILAVSHILAGGNYNLPGFGNWALGASLLFATFTPILIVLGGVAVANAVVSAFGPNPWKMAGEMIMGIAHTIVGVSHILGGGNYVGGPDAKWAEGVAIALGAFSPVYSMLVRNKIFEFLGLGGVGPDDFARAIKTVVGGIVEAASAFNNANASFLNPPPKEWAEGVGLAIGAFAPVYEVLAKSKGWITSGPSVEDMKRAIMTISSGIVDAANFFGDNKAAFDISKAPPKEWAESVGGAIQAFVPALDFISKNSGVFRGTGVIKRAIKATVLGIVTASQILADGEFSSTIPSGWVDGISVEMKKYIDFLSYVKKVKLNIKVASNRVRKISMSMLHTSETIKNIGQNISGVNSNWMDAIDNNMRRYVRLAMWITETTSKYKSGNLIQRTKDWWNNLSGVSKVYSDLAKGVGKLNSELENLDVEKLNALKSLTGSIVLMSLMDSEQFNRMMDELESRAGDLVEAMSDFDKNVEEKNKKLQSTSPTIRTSSGGQAGASRNMDDLYQIMTSIDARLSSIESSNNNLSTYVDEIRSGDLDLKK